MRSHARERKRHDKRILIQVYGDTCINCGSASDIEWHHVVPLEIGGCDVPSNLVPLCYTCHKAVSNHQHRLKYYGRDHKHGGRPRKIPDNYVEVLTDFFYCRIGAAETKRRLGLSGSNHLADNPWFHDARKRLVVMKYRNNVDMNGGKGYVVLDNGTRMKWG